MVQWLSAIEVLFFEDFDDRFIQKWPLKIHPSCLNAKRHWTMLCGKGVSTLTNETSYQYMFILSRAACFLVFIPPKWSWTFLSVVFFNRVRSELIWWLNYTESQWHEMGRVICQRTNAWKPLSIVGLCELPKVVTIICLGFLHRVNAVIVYLSGKIVGFHRGREGIDEVYLALQLASSTFVNCIKDWIFFCDRGFLSIPSSNLLTLSGWSLVIRITVAVNKLWFLGINYIGHVCQAEQVNWCTSALAVWSAFVVSFDLGLLCLKVSSSVSGMAVGDDGAWCGLAGELAHVEGVCWWLSQLVWPWIWGRTISSTMSSSASMAGWTGELGGVYCLHFLPWCDGTPA